MIRSLGIRNVVLIDDLTIVFEPGLGVLTGETGAGKSILLDALGLALGARGDVGLVRAVAKGDPPAATVTASFEIAPDHPALALLAEQGLPAPEPGDALILRRTLAADGRSRAFVNDEPVSIGFLRGLGDRLVEIEGQFASQGLLDPATHRAALDSIGKLERRVRAVADAHGAWRRAAVALAAAEEAQARARQEEDYLRHAAAELAALEPKAGEEATLAETRSRMMHGEKLAEALSAADAALSGDGGVEGRFATARRALLRIAERAGGRLDPVLAALDRASDEAAEAAAALERAAAALEADPRGLEAAEERLFALRAMARKYRVEPDALASLRDEFAARLGALDDSGRTRAELAKTVETSRRLFLDEAEALSEGRKRAARTLDKAVAAELGPLKLERAVFRTRIDRLDEGEWSAHGLDRVTFEVATNPGAAPGPIGRIASGGELARFLLAVKVALQSGSSATTLVFDEVDAGIGGATAAAVGQRLARLAATTQVLVVTHSPQVAACGTHHWRVVKREGRGGTRTEIEPLSPEARREEVARMLAGTRVTDEARAAADKLIAGQR